MRKVSLFYGVGLLVMSYNVASAQPRIIGGVLSPVGQWPWMVALVEANKEPIDGQFCGGTLIHPEWVLTAGHCTDNDKTKHVYKPEELYVFMGSTSLKSKEAERVKITEIIRHPNYQRSDEPPFDIALLHLEKRFDHIPILSLVEPFSSLDASEKWATVMGWGRTSRFNSHSFPENLYQTDLPIVSNAVCNGKDSYNGSIKETMLCAGFKDGHTDACEGDSGGPLIVADCGEKTSAILADEVLQEKCHWRQVGIVSFGEDCAKPNFYGVYTRLSLLRDFVTQHICSDEETPAAPELHVAIDGQTATATWNKVTKADNYQLYYAPYSPDPLSLTLDTIHSVDVGIETQLSYQLPSNTALYVAIRAFHGNCPSGYSNLDKVIIP